MTLLSETLDCMTRHDKTRRDVRFIGSLHSGHACTWAEFVELADFEYDSGFGGQEVATDLVIIFKDKTKMSRWEYDGSEGWQFHSIPIIPKDQKPITTLIGGMWNKLEVMNDDN